MGSRGPGGHDPQYEFMYDTGASSLKLVETFLETAGFMIFIELEKQGLLGKPSNHFQNDPFDKAFMNNILYFASEYLKGTFEKSCHIKSGPSGMVLVWSIK